MTSIEDFLAGLDRDLADLAREDADLATEEDRIRHRRSELKTQATDLSRTREVIATRIGVSTGRRPETGLFDDRTDIRTNGGVVEVKRPSRGAGGTVAELAYQEMVAQGGRMRVADLVRYLASIGKVKGNHGDYGTVHGTLTRDPRFIQVAKGEFALVASAPERPTD